MEIITVMLIKEMNPAFGGNNKLASVIRTPPMSQSFPASK